MTTPQRNTPIDLRSSGVGEEESSDFDRLLSYLRSKGADGFLDNIPAPDLVEFAELGNFLKNSLPRKLLVGRQRNTENKIYAYMQKKRQSFHEINFYAESKDGREKISSRELPEHTILHPFDKTYPVDLPTINQSDRVRLTLMVKWYFIAAGHAKDIVLKEAKGYPMRLRRALEYIAQRMDSAVTRSLRSASVGPSTEADVNPSTPRISTTFRTVPFSSPVATEEQPIVVCNTAEDASLHSTKRPAETDPDVESLIRSLSEKIAYKKSKIQDIATRMRDVEQSRKLLQVQIQNLDVEWNGLEATRKDIITSFERLSSAFSDES
ncbi:hypothetical protein DPSP01_014539 [Paraphaeosphaeria sporulosa]